MNEARKRTIIKCISWRFFASGTTVILVFIFTGNMPLSLGLGSADIVTKLILYYLHERAWNKVYWGKR
jgi:uncharacterized membrane protein